MVRRVVKYPPILTAEISHETHRFTHSFTALLVLIFLFLPLSAALADYLGPDRTRTESEVETYDYGVWASRDDLSCNPTNDPPACIQCTWERDPFTAPCAINPPTDRYYWYKLGTRSEVVERTVTYPEATINGALNGCTLQNGWCVTSPVLALSASEPVAGYEITLIEGARNGEAFACSGASCGVPLLEGENAFTFWALSSWGDSSRMGTLTAQVDTQPPQVNGELSGTPGEAGWYVSPVTVFASAADPEPGSGIQALTYALNGGAWTPYTASLTLNDGVHNVTFRAADAAGYTAEASASVRVDTLPPQVNASLAGEQVNGWYLGQAILSASAADPSTGSGLARIEYAPDPHAGAGGGAWQPYAAPVTFGGGTHTVQVRAFDQAGNASAPASLTFRVDGTAPRIQLTDAWYIWQTGEVKVSDEGSGLANVEIQIRDGQGRWQPVTRASDVDGGTFRASIAWDRTFADGTTAPIGEYDVIVTARDLAGNESRETARLLIPAPNATMTPLPTRRVEPAETRTPLPAPIAMATLPAPTAPRAMVVQSFQSSNPSAAAPHSPFTTPHSSFPLWGAAATAAITAATAYALAQRRKRKDEEARQRAEAQREAARRNAAEEARKAQAYLLAQQIRKAQERAEAQARGQWIEQQEADDAVFIQQMLAAQQKRRAEEAKARQQVWQDYRAGERAEYVTPGAPPVPMCTPTVFDRAKPWWIPSFSIQEASRLVRAIPSVEVASNRIPVPVAKIVAPGKMISFGTVTAWNFGSNANPGAELRTDGLGAGTINEPDKPSAFVRANLEPAEISSGMRFPAGLGFAQDGFSSSLGYSVNAYARWDGWNTTVSIELNYADVETSGAGMKGNISKGVYLEVKPLQVATVALGATALVLTPWPDELSLPALIEFLGNLVRNPTLGVP